MLTKTNFHFAVAACMALLACGLDTAFARPTFDWAKDDTLALKDKIDAGEYGTVTSALILKDGDVVFEAYSNGADPQTLHNTRSVGKTITSFAIGHAIMMGELSLETKPAKYFTDLAPFQNSSVEKLDLTIEDLLTMSGPLECDDQNSFSRGNEERMYIVKDWSAFFWNLPLRGYPAWATKPENADFGRSFSYCTAGVQILGETLSRATGIPFTDYVNANLFAPMGIDNFEWQMNAEGQAHMGGGLMLSGRDWAKFGELQRNGGQVSNSRLLTHEWVDAAGTPQARVPNSPGLSYGYLWWLFPFEVAGEKFTAQIMNGNGGNRVIVMPEFGVTAVITKTDFGDGNAIQKTDQFMFEEVISRIK